MGVQVVDHPLASSLLTDLRDKSTPPPLFRLLAKRLALVLCVEATKGMLMTAVEVQTPLAPAAGARLAQPLVAVPVLRAGLGMLDAVTELFPEVTVGYVGLERDHATFEPSLYYSKLPPLEGRAVLLPRPDAGYRCFGGGGLWRTGKGRSCPNNPPVGGVGTRGHCSSPKAAPRGQHRDGLDRRRPRQARVHCPRPRRLRGPALRDRLAIPRRNLSSVPGKFLLAMPRATVRS